MVRIRSNSQPTMIRCSQKAFIVLHTTLLVCKMFRCLVNTGANYKNACRVTVFLTLLTPYTSIADTLHLVSHHLVDSYTKQLAWGIADISVENNNSLGNSVFSNRATKNSKLQQPTVSASAKIFQPIKNDREMLKQLRSLISTHTNTHSSINWLPASSAERYFEKSSHHTKLDKSAIRTALKNSIIQWWQNRKALSNKRKGTTLTTKAKSAQVTSHAYKKNWGYKINVSSSKIKFTLKREL